LRGAAFVTIGDEVFSDTGELGENDNVNQALIPAPVLLKNEANVILPISSCQLFRNGILDLNQIKSPRAETIV
jgi:hypothetical protein